MKIVCDTNVFISSLIFGGNPERIIKRCRKKELSLVVSPAILFEVSRILKDKFGWIKSDIDREIVSIMKIAQVINPTINIKKVTNDPTDNRILECAIEGKTDYVITGDKKHLLPLKKFRNISIVSPQEFLKKVMYSRFHARIH
jgi:putative PIN family toxin of toxin-antitoxin system